MYYVYLIRSTSDPKQKYVGFTTDLSARIVRHNEGGSSHTSRYLPWKLVCSISFESKRAALEFEAYLKSGSGRAFAEKRLWISDSQESDCDAEP